MILGGFLGWYLASFIRDITSFKKVSVFEKLVESHKNYVLFVLLPQVHDYQQK